LLITIERVNYTARHYISFLYGRLNSNFKD